MDGNFNKFFDYLLVAGTRSCLDRTVLRNIRGIIRDSYYTVWQESQPHIKACVDSIGVPSRTPTKDIIKDDYVKWAMEKLDKPITEYNMGKPANETNEDNEFMQFVIDYLSICSLDELRTHPINPQERLKFLKEKFNTIDV